MHSLMYTHNLLITLIASPFFLFLYIVTSSVLTSIFLHTHCISHGYDSPQSLLVTLYNINFKVLHVQREHVMSYTVHDGVVARKIPQDLMHNYIYKVSSNRKLTLASKVWLISCVGCCRL